MSDVETRPLFPLIRHLSARITPHLLRLPITPNQVTATALVCGLAAGGLLLSGRRDHALLGALLLIVAYVLDNCDGEIARLKNLCSVFGHWFDSFVDWLVHVVFFVALGIGVTRASGDEYWQWLGWIAASGATANYLIGQAREWRRGPSGAVDPSSDERAALPVAKPTGWGEWLLFAFRELSRADFCFLVLGLALLDGLWLLLPVGAIGAQVYWATQLVRGADRYHV